MRIFKILGLLLLASALFMSCSKDDEVKPEPTAIEVFVRNYFPDNKILEIKEVVVIDGSKKYEVKLEGDIDMTFNNEMEIYEIVSKTRLPDILFPETLVNLVANEHDGSYIIGMRIEVDYLYLKISNGETFKFPISKD